MEISDEPNLPASEEDLFQKEVRTVFQETLGLIHIALVAHYGLQEGEAVELEKDLYIWFVRFCSRPGNSSIRELRPFLMIACCQFAREYQKYVIGTGIRESDEKLKKLLDRDPEDVVRDYSKSLDILKYRRHDV